MAITTQTNPATGIDVPGRLVGRERHVLAEADGSVARPTWLDGLSHQRVWAAELAQEMATPRWRSLPEALPVLSRSALIAARSLRGGTAAAAPRLRRLFLTRGPTFLKIGQLISGGGGLFPETLVTEFEGFRDRLPPEPPGHVRRLLNEDLPGGESRFARFDPEPLAAASIAQVHAATLLDGREVVVKVQRPEVTARVVRDLTWLATVAGAVDRVPQARSGNLPGIVEYLAETVAEELDFRLEAENMLDVAEAVSRSEDGAGVAVPRPHAELVTRRVLVMERFEGFASTDHAGIVAAGIDTGSMLRAGFRCFVEGALVHGVFHGDLHPGNVMVLKDGRYGILDYGIVGRLDPRQRSGFAQMMAAGATGDLRGQLEALRDLGAYPPEVDIDALARDVDPGMLPDGMRLPNLAQVRGSLQASLALMRRHRFRLPKLLVLLTKNLIFADDAVRRFAPDLDLMAESAPIFARAGLHRASEVQRIGPLGL